MWLAGTAVADGKKRHRPVLAEWPEGASDGLVAIAQRCFPLRRQQAGSFEAALDAATTGAISEKLKRATSSDARTRRMCIFYSLGDSFWVVGVILFE